MHNGMASRDNIQKYIFDEPSAEVPARTEQSESRPQRSANRMVNNLAVMVCLFCCCYRLDVGLFQWLCRLEPLRHTLVCMLTVVRFAFGASKSVDIFEKVRRILLLFVLSAIHTLKLLMYMYVCTTLNMRNRCR